MLFYLAIVAAMRPNHDRPGPLTLLPIARSPSRPRYRVSLVGSYPTVSAITPVGAGLFSVAVVVEAAFQRSALTYCFVRRSCPEVKNLRTESREVPLLYRAATDPLIQDDQLLKIDL